MTSSSNYMRRIIDAANSEKEYILREDTNLLLELDLLNSRHIEELRKESGIEEAWAGEPASEEKSSDVWYDDVSGKWHWLKAIDGNIVARGSCYTEEEAKSEAFG